MGGGGKVKLPYLQVFEAKGRRFADYRRNGKRQRIPDEIGSADWLAAYQRIHASFEVPGPGQSVRGSVAAVVAEFKASPEHRELAPSTRRAYASYLDDIAGRCGALPIADMPRKFVFDLRDRYAATPRKANHTVEVLRRLLSFAVDRGYRSDTPALRPRQLKTGPGYRPWRDDEIAAFRRRWATDTVERVPFELAIGTGQRGGDLVKLTRADYAAGRIILRQGKTGETVDLPALPDLRAVLDPWLASHDAILLLVTTAGRSFKTDYFRPVMARAYEAAGLDGSQRTAFVTRRPRLAEAGCDWVTIATVTGHRTAEMVRRYTSKRRRSNEALNKLHGTVKRDD